MLLLIIFSLYKLLKPKSDILKHTLCALLLLKDNKIFEGLISPCIILFINSSMLILV